MTFESKYTPKYENGGVNSQDQQEMIEFVNWLPEGIQPYKDQLPGDFVSGVEQAQNPEEIVAALNNLVKTENGKQIVQSLFQAYTEEKKQKFKLGGKIDAFVNRFGKGGIVKAQKSTPGGLPEKPSSWIQLLNAVAQYYNGDNSAYIELARNRNMLGENMAKREDLGEYVNDNPYIEGNKNGVVYVNNGFDIPDRIHGADSAAIVNRAFDLLKKAGIKPAFPQRNASEPWK